MQWLRAALVTAGLALVLVPAPASAQIHNCGPFEIIFRNPDLQPGTDGFITAEGAFFAQFQVIGAGAEAVVTMGFSFGAYTTDFQESTVCPDGSPPQTWQSGQQIPNYRADTDASDGFFINLQTPLVPDGEYTAAVHAYDASDNELGRFWAKAIVNNCDAAGPMPPARCDGDVPQNTNNDRTGPWPMILPGDGAKLPEGTTGFSLEFAEELANLTVYLNGKDITAELEAWDGRLWDDDLLPGYGPNGLGAILVPECSQQPPQECTTLGEAYRWNTRPLTDADFLRVEAADLAGNTVVKSIHIGSSVAGGAISEDFAILTHTVDVREIAVVPGSSATFGFTITNQGGGTGHPAAAATGPDGWTLEWQPTHVPVEPGQTKDQALVVTPPATTLAGRYEVNATLTYQRGGDEEVIAQPLVIVVGGDNVAGTEGNSTASGGKKGSPAASPIVLLTAFAAVALVVRRRRD
jgi:hypothetical protein